MKRILLATAASAVPRHGRLGAGARQRRHHPRLHRPARSRSRPAWPPRPSSRIKEASDSGKLPGGITLTPIRANSTCIDAAAATTAAQQLVNAQNVAAIVGADCSGVTTAIANNVAIPAGVVMVSPSATSPALTTIEDNGYFFRTAPSDARQGEILAAVVKEKGIDNVAITYTNNDYGKGLADAFASRLRGRRRHGRDQRPRTRTARPTIPPRSARCRPPAPPALMVLGYVDQGGVGIVQASLDTGAFEQLLLRRRHVRPEPDRQDRRRDQRQGHRHAARRRGRGRRQVRRRSPRPPAWTRPAPTSRRATTPPR